MVRQEVAVGVGQGGQDGAWLGWEGQAGGVWGLAVCSPCLF